MAKQRTTTITIETVGAERTPEALEALKRAYQIIHGGHSVRQNGISVSSRARRGPAFGGPDVERGRFRLSGPSGLGHLFLLPRARKLRCEPDRGQRGRDFEGPASSLGVGPSEALTPIFQRRWEVHRRYMLAVPPHRSNCRHFGI